MNVTFEAASGTGRVGGRRRAALPRSPATMGRKLVEMERQLRSLAQDLCRTEDRERERIACLLHDELGSQIVHIRLKLGEWRHAGASGAQGAADEMTALVTDLGQTVRALTFALAPPAWHGGLLPALEALACELGQRAGLEVCVVAASRDIDVPERQRALACRVVRELCLNVHKHAQARHVEIAPRLQDGWLCIRVQDDGRGLLPSSTPATSPSRIVRFESGLGLASARAQLRAMGGSLHVQSEAGGGTCARVLLPILTA
jgi:signal transduction histidine kinase